MGHTGIAGNLLNDSFGEAHSQTQLPSFCISPDSSSVLESCDCRNVMWICLLWLRKSFCVIIIMIATTCIIIIIITR